VPRTDLQATGDREAAESLLREPDVRRAIERFEKRAKEVGARRHLLATALRLTPEMAPDVHGIVEGCRTALGIQTPLEVYVYPEAQFNAAAVRPEGGRLFLMLSSALLEAFEADELRFVIGHELGHHLFEHHRIPVSALLQGPDPMGPALALRLFSWQRYAEISADRAGLACAGSLEPAARALFKLASGLRGDRVHARIDQFLAQVAELRDEESRAATAESPARSDWFATHPFSPLRLRAADLCARSELVAAGGTPRARLEAEVDELMGIMGPSYLQERSDVAEAMRRLLFAGGVAVAASAGAVVAEEIEALERLLGIGSIPSELRPDVIRADLPRRIASVNELVPALRRAQVVRDLCVIAQADGKVTDDEIRVLHEIADAVDVDRSVVAFTTAESSMACAHAPPAQAWIVEAPKD
jgi:tellurite resistance protein